jgi:hypothetical protein
MDNLYQNTIINTDSDYESSSEEDDINLKNIDYTNQYFLNNSSQSEYLDKRNELFTKDIIKQRILVDTHNIKTNGTTPINTNNYTYYLNNVNQNNTSGEIIENYNETGGYDRYKNVIGFRFIKAIIPNRTYTINPTNNVVIIQLGTTTSDNDDDNKQIKITLAQGFFITSTLTNAFDSSFGAIYEWNGTAGTTTALESTYKITSTFNETNKLFTFTMNSTYDFKFIYNDNNEEGSRNLLGFTRTIPNASNSIEAEQPPDMSIHYFDIVIQEIPYIACKHNTDRRNVIERIPIVSSNDELLVYEDSTFERDDQNLFFPISLNKLTIQLYQKNGNLFHNNNKHHSLEFEITMINKVDIIK